MNREADVFIIARFRQKIIRNCGIYAKKALFFFRATGYSVYGEKNACIDMFTQRNAADRIFPNGKLRRFN